MVAHKWKVHDPAWAQQIIDPIVARNPEHAVANYWLAVTVHMQVAKWSKARGVLQRVLSWGYRSPTWEMWLPAAVHNRLGEVAYYLGQNQVAATHFDKAHKLATTYATRGFAQGFMRRIRAEASRSIQGRLDASAPER